MSFAAAVASDPRAVVDLERLVAASRADGRVAWAAHNGRAVAWAAGHRWVSHHDDGDVLVVLDGQLHNLFDPARGQAELAHERYRALGYTLARGLLGDFIMIVMDRTRGALLVCRDPVGVRPWYQASSGRRHVGATEVATLCRTEWVDDSIDESTALAYLAGEDDSYGPTFHRGITTLPPGSTWRVSGDGASTVLHHQWRIDPEPELAWDAAVDRCREVVTEAVRSRVQAAGAATSELSGGLDSSSIVGTAVGLGYEDIVVGRLLFEGRRADERSYSDSVIEHWGLRAVSAPPWVPTEQEATGLTMALRRPVPDANFTMFAGLHRALQAEGRQGALTGLGGDDAFVAMSRRSRIVTAAQQRQYGILAGALREDLGDPRKGWRRTWRPLLGYLSPRVRRRVPLHVALDAARRAGLVARLAEAPLPLTGLRAIDDRAEGLTSGYVAGILETAAVVGDLSGWRGTHPFLDPRVITATYGLNPWFAARGSHDRALEVAAFADSLPSMVRERRSKAEFSELVWQGADLQALGAAILRGPMVTRGWLDADGFATLLEAAQGGDPRAAVPFSRTAALDRWMTQFPS